MNARSVGVLEQVARRLVGAGEPGADHHRGGAGGEGERDVARVPHSPVGPHVLAEVPGGRRALEHRGELRAPDAGHHPGRAHRAGPDADLDDVGAGLDQCAGALGGDHVAGHHRDRRVERADGAERLDHPVLVAVRGVDDQAVDAGVEQLGRLGPDVAVDPDGGGDPQRPGASTAGR